MIIKGFKNYCTVVIMAFIFGMGITIFVTDYFGDCALKIMECEAKAADINAYEWEKESSSNFIRLVNSSGKFICKSPFEIYIVMQ